MASNQAIKQKHPGRWRDEIRIWQYENIVILDPDERSKYKTELAA